MKVWIVILTAIFTSSLFFCPVVKAEMVSKEEIIEELKVLKARMNRLEQELARKDREVEGLKAKVERPSEGAPAEEGEKKWSDRITLSGAIEVEYGREKTVVKDPATGRSSSSRDEDLTLSTVELHTDAQINKYTKGDVVFLYEEDEDEDRPG